MNTTDFTEVAGVKWATENYREGDKEHFTWDEAMAINVPGWRLPTSNDVCNLIQASWTYEPCADGDKRECLFWIASSVSGDEAEALTFDAHGIGLRLLPKDRKLRIRLIKCSENEDSAKEPEAPGLRYNDSNAFKTTTYNDIIAEMRRTYEAKSHDYGNSFEQSLDDFGIVASVVRISDKFNRLKSLSQAEARVSDESMRDTLLDMANYAVMTAMWLDKHSRNE